MAKVYITVDLGFGDSGKGTIVDYLCSEKASKTSLVVRYNGGPQAAHNVVRFNGAHHTFAQIGSGTFSGCDTYLSKYMLINPFALINEANALPKDLGKNFNPLKNIYIDGQAKIITPFHKAANKIREAWRGDKKHGSCGMGIGETVSDALNGRFITIDSTTLLNEDLIIKKLKMIQEAKRAELLDIIKDVRKDEDIMYEISLLERDDIIQICLDKFKELNKNVNIVGNNWLYSHANDYEQIIFEGAQGTLLDEKIGFHPYTTWTNTTTNNAIQLIKDAKLSDNPTTIGIIRTYTSRHGPGPFVSENISMPMPEEHNVTNKWQGNFRVGELDLVATKYAIDMNDKIDYLAVTHCDWTYPYVCTSYKYKDIKNREFLQRFFYLGPYDRIKNLRPGENLIEQEKLTNLLFDCDPIIEPVQGNFIEYLSSELKKPIAITSYGKTCGDKQKLISI